MKEFYMSMAIEMSKKGIGFINPDPLVGAVIIKNNCIIGKGFYKAFGEITAEQDAINNSIEDVKGSELYINIEPSCEDILRYGFKKVFIGIEHPLFKGSQIAELRKCGVEVELNILQESCRELNEISLHYYNYGQPFVFTKWAMTLDGKIATTTGDSKWISGQGSLEFVHHLRQRVAAIMVGENTVRLDNPLLTTRLEGVEISNPLRVILSTYGDIKDEANVLKVDEKTKTLLVTSVNIPKEKEQRLLGFGVKLLKLPEENGKIDFKVLVKALGEMGIDSLYIEGGSGVLGAAFESGIVNLVYAAVAPKIIGGSKAVTPVGGKGIEKMKDAIVLKRVSHVIVGDDVIIKGYI